MPTVRGIVRESAKDDYKFSSIVMQIVHERPVPEAPGAVRYGSGSEDGAALIAS